jgi:nitrogenase molybdenum-iron protein alpha/beta subunit
MHEIAEAFKERFGMPFVTFPGVPVGPKETSRLLKRWQRPWVAAGNVSHR